MQYEYFCPLERAEEALAAGWGAAPQIFMTPCPDDSWGLGTPGAAAAGSPICGHYTEIRVVRGDSGWINPTR